MRAAVALIRDTFREAFARKIFWGFYALSTLIILFFLLLLQVDLAEGARAAVLVLGITVRRFGGAEAVARAFSAGVSVFLFTWGLALAVFASGSLAPSLLEPGRIELLLSKPVSRPVILLSRYAGILLVVGLNVVYLVGGVWLILGWKTGVWHAEFLAAIPAVAFVFASYLALSTWVSVMWESAAVAVMAPMALMLLSPVLAQEAVVVKLLSSEWSRAVFKGIYWVVPKFYDIGRAAMQYIRQRPVDDFAAAAWSTAAFGCVMLAAGLWVFVKRDF
jgi:ABC-type transport system involved in multi-copper enzyme maturation permease subunit